MTAQPITPGTVTAADLYGEVTAARRDVAQILTKVEIIDDRHGRIAGQVADHEARLRALEAGQVPRLGERVRALERWQWRAGGLVAAFAIVGGLMAGFINALIVHGH